LNGFLGADIKPGARGDEETFNSIEWIQIRQSIQPFVYIMPSFNSIEWIPESSV